MTIQEAYEIFYGKSQEKITKELIEKKLTIEIIKKDYRKLIKKFHPDIHDNNEDYNEIMKQINLAYEVLTSIFKSKNNTTSKSVIKIMDSNDEEIIKILPLYMKILKYAYRLRSYKIKSKLYKNTNYYYAEIVNGFSPAEIYKSIQEYNEINIAARTELTTIKNLYNSINQMIANKNYNADYMEKTLKDIAGEYYDSLNNPLLRMELENWENRELESSERKYKDQLSYIKNYRAILTRILKNSKLLNDIICQKNLNKNAILTLSSIKQKSTLIIKYETLQKYCHFRKIYTKKMIDWEELVLMFLDGLEDLNDDKDIEKFFERLDHELTKRIPKEHLPLISDDESLSKINDKDYRKSIKEYNKNNSQLDKEYKEISKKLKKEIIDIRNFILPYEEKGSQLISPSDGNDLVKTLINYQKKAIILYYKIFICYFVNTNNSMLPYEIESIYNEITLANSSSQLDYRVIEVYYNTLKKKYNELKFNRFEYSSKIERQTTKTIAYDIKELISFMEDKKVKIPEHIILLMEKIDELDLIEMYRLHKYVLDIIYPDIKKK